MRWDYFTVATIPLFRIGRVHLTVGVTDSHLSADNIGALLHRHTLGDWGDVSENLRERNNEALLDRSLPKISAFHVLGMQDCLIVTEPGESEDAPSTLVMLRSEFELYMEEAI